MTDRLDVRSTWAVKSSCAGVHGMIVATTAASTVGVGISMTTRTITTAPTVRWVVRE